ncbi:AMP-binding protein, partial [Streptomyces phytophilus]|uniref:AMP-binding protein n=1 Tax=Streptomyces phytophilus TaxID=722715 RepID=UPI001C68F4D0
MTPGELGAYQLDRLRATLRRAYDNVPLHRRRFDAAGVTPDDCRTLADLARFPFTTKDDLREDYPFGMFAVPVADVRRLHASSGTTGLPTVVGYTAADLDIWSGLVARSIRAAGGRPGHRVHVAYGYGLFTGGLGAHYGAERLGCTVIPASGGMTARQVQLIRDFAPEVIMVTPSYMLTIIDEFERQGIDPRTSSLRVGIFGAEPWTEEMRHEIEERAGLDAVDIYGLSEVIGPGVAQECVETKDGLHVWEDHFLPEVVDPVTGEVMPAGEGGELVFTSLTKEAVPVVRYRTRDLSRLLPGTARPAFRRMEKVTGRCDDMIILRGVNVFPSQIEEIVLRTPGVAPHFQLRLTRRGRLDRMTVRAEARPGAPVE